MMFALPSTGLLNTGQRVIRMPSGIPIEHRQSDGGSDQPEMFGGELQNFGVVLLDELQDIHG